MFFQSIRFRIMVWYMLLLALTLSIFSFAIYGSFNKLLYDNLDDLLSSRAEGVGDSITTYWAAKAGPASQDASGMTDFLKSAGNWVEEKRHDPELMSVFVQVSDKSGERLIASKNMPSLETLPKDVLADVADGDDSFDVLKGKTAEGKVERFRSYTKPVMENGRVEYLAQVVAPIGLLTLAVQNLMWALFLLFPLTVILAGLPGVFLVRLTLRPIDAMVNTIKKATAENLKLKIHIPDTKDEIRRLADTFNDMIERLDKSFSSQQSFIQDISCELKVPLASLEEKFKTVLNKPSSSQEYDSILKYGLEEMKKLKKIIEELESLAKFDNYQMALEVRKVNISRLLGQVLDNIRPAADQKDIIISSFLQDTVIIDGDEKQLKQLFMNLLDNAVKYTLRKGKITVSIHKDKKHAMATVSDTGIGVEDNELPYIFDRFYQINKSRASNGGFGLGLSIAKSVAELHKATIAVESRVGKGSTFSVCIPLSYQG